ncbi:recombinase family protein [Flavobacterium sp. SM15]|uniref:recombinase family protein n=1 Tax=Flavobacterium sp. SM15 TaxID=2908005 RepID=UPI001EDA7496|nr:recombinase family protein [Flavobacterium sp. SM15]MCG2611524.1 recombinase family protein [Flavobacterium sp. SM15]
MKARYVRVSSQSQNPARQLAKRYPDEKLFIDVISGSIPFNERPQGKELIKAIEAKEITQISTSSVDRLGRSSFDCQHSLNWLKEMGVNVCIDNLGISSILPNGKYNGIFKMITDVLSNVAEMEREAIRERQSEGIAIAKARGVYSKSRNKPSMSDDDILAKYPAVVKELKLGNNSLRKVAKLAGVSLGTVQKVKDILFKDDAVN